MHISKSRVLLAPDRQQPEQLLLRACPGLHLSPVGRAVITVLRLTWAVSMPCLKSRLPPANLLPGGGGVPVPAATRPAAQQHRGRGELNAAACRRLALCLHPAVT